MELKDLTESLLNKAKELADSETVDKLRDAAAGSGIRDVYEKGAQKAKSLGNQAKLAVDLSHDRKELERTFTEIGRLYYERNGSDGDSFFSPLFDKAKRLQEAIAELEAQLKANRSSSDAAPAEGAVIAPDDLKSDIADFEAIVDRTETDGTST